MQFRFASLSDRVAYIIGTCFAILTGIGPVLMIIVFRAFINKMFGSEISLKNTYPLILAMLAVGLSIFISVMMQILTFSFAANRQLDVIRLRFFKAILRQDVAWFDQHTSGALISRLSQDIEQIHLGIGIRLGIFVQNIFGFLGGIVTAFAYGWKLSLVALATLPVTAATFTVFSILMKKFNVKELTSYALAGEIASEVLNAIRTVISFGFEQTCVDKYSASLSKAEKSGILKSTVIGGVAGVIGLTLYGSMALAFWYGVELMITENYDPGTVILVTINIILGGIYLGNAIPNLPYIAAARSAAKDVYGTIDRIPPIDKDKRGLEITDLTGNFVFVNTYFAYPSRPDINVLENFNLEVRAGEKVALVGPSGSGKSTVIQLLLRFFDPIKGEVFIEGANLKHLNLKHLRDHIGCVGQEPLLFDASIADNIRLGRLDASEAEVEQAARLANAHDFIRQLPQGYQTRIGARGVGLSGGEKQRIAIARALIKKPKFLILDEATSALDSGAEKVVQQALDAACVGRTVLMIAHRLSTVRNADRIIVLDKGQIREQGTHQQLVDKQGIYAQMLHQQKFTTDVQAAGEGNSVEIEDRDVCDNIIKNDDEDHHDVISFQSMVSDQKGRSDKTYLFEYIGQPDVMREKVKWQCITIMAFSFSILIVHLGQGFFFGVSGERLVHRIRSMFFDSILKQEVGFFDRPSSQPGLLTSRLAKDASEVKNVSGIQLGHFLEAINIVLVSFGIAFYFSWQLTLLFAAFYPFFLISGSFQLKIFSDKSNANTDGNGNSSAQEAIAAHRTVATLCLEQYFTSKFANAIDSGRRHQLKEALSYATFYGISQAISPIANSATFALGIYLIGQKAIGTADIFRVFAVLSLSAQTLGRTTVLGPDYVKAKQSALYILSVMDRKSKIPKDEGSIPVKPFEGNVAFKNVFFRYPCRPDVMVLKGFSHSVTPNSTVALVGQSGCGKSTLLQLVQRFYDPVGHHSLRDDGGSGIFFDAFNLRNLAPSWIRRQLAVVSQEPYLFNTTIKENIAYGDTSRDIPMSEIIQAARDANIHDFIITLPEGYETVVGEGGCKLSGGQKQRVAIARALVRKPKLLILDEATSALDSESERVVQEALDRAVGSRTSLVVAHRLNTVQSADQVVVLQNGQCVESGNPQRLMESKGAFYALHEAVDEN